MTHEQQEQQQEQRLTARLPVTMREVPETWWDALLNGTPWYICMDDFEVKATTLPNIRLFAYRRAQLRGVHVSTALERGSRRLYIWATQEHLGRTPLDWSKSRPAPAMHTINGINGQVVAEEILKSLVTLLRTHGYEVNPPQPPSLPRTAQLAKPLSVWDLAVPPGWTRSQYTGQLLPPGVPDIEGAVYEDGETPDEIREGAAEFALIKSRCSCGSSDLRRHDVTCAAWVA